MKEKVSALKVLTRDFVKSEVKGEVERKSYVKSGPPFSVEKPKYVAVEVSMNYLNN